MGRIFLTGLCINVIGVLFCFTFIDCSGLPCARNYKSLCSSLSLSNRKQPHSHLMNSEILGGKSVVLTTKQTHFRGLPRFPSQHYHFKVYSEL